MFAVDGKNPDSVFSSLVLHQLAGHDHRLFICQGNVFSTADGGEGREEAGGADDGGNHQFGIEFGGDGGNSFFTGQNLHGKRGASSPKECGGGFGRDGDSLGSEPVNLLF